MSTKTFKIGLSNTDKANMAASVRSQIEAMLIPAYSTSTTYNLGDFVVYRASESDPYQLYRCKENNVSGAWNSSKWELATLGDLADQVNESVKKDVITDLYENKEYSYQLLVNSNDELILRLTEL